MTNERFHKREIELLKIIPPTHFRTVESFHMKKTSTEIGVEIDLKDTFLQKLSFKAPWDGKLYAYARITKEFEQLCNEINIAAKEIKLMYLEDWDAKFSLIIEGENNNRELSFYVSSFDVLELLMNCCRIPEQKVSAP